MGSLFLVSCGGGDGSPEVSIPVVPAAANRVPTVSGSIAAQEAAQDRAITITVPSSLFSDPDGDALTLSFVRADGSALPGWLSVNGASLSGVPDFNDVGTLTLRVTASDGRGGTASSDFTLRVQAASAISISPRSYSNFKEVGLLPTQFNFSYTGFDNMRAYGDFSGQRRLGLLIASVSSNTVAPPVAPLRFYDRTKVGAFTPSALTISDQENGCVLPRKGVTADFNKDGRPDVFLACTGRDADPFPGEQNAVVLSQPNGSYIVRKASVDVGYFHGATSADFNSDGNVDVVATGCAPEGGFVQLVCQFVGAGDGSFKRLRGWSLMTGNSGPYFSIETADVNGDGLFDIILGGHEWEASTKLFINPGNNDFSSVRPVPLPAVPGEGVVLDFLVTGQGAQRALWILRTGGDPSNQTFGNTNFYRGVTVQRIDVATMNSSVVYSQRAQQWLPWIIPASDAQGSYISGDRGQDNLRVPY